MRRSILALLAGLMLGYFLGYFDAYRGASTLGAHVADLIDKVHPDQVSKQRAKETAKFHEQIQAAAGVADSLAQKPDPI